MMYIVHVEQKSLRAHSDPMPAATALKVAKAWQSHGDQGVLIVEVGADTSGKLSWTIREFIAYTKEAAALRGRKQFVEEAIMEDPIQRPASA